MSSDITYLHSHSGLERTLKDKDIANKSHVLVNEKFKNEFADMCSLIRRFEYDGTVYYKVPTLAFVHKGGIFKNFSK